MRKLSGVMAVITMTGALAVPALGAGSRRASVGDLFIRPGKLTISAGTRVTWHWVGSLGHTVTVKSGPAHFGSRLMSTGSYSHVFTRRGTYHLYCRVHPGMRETVIVR